MIMHLLHKRFRLLATILVKDEEDILKDMIEHHLNAGVDAFIITNNRSTDKTREIAENYKQVLKIFDELDNTHHQEAHVTKMARYACKYKPEWIVHLDADEFWNGFDFLNDIKENGVISTLAYIHPPVHSEFGFNPIKQRFYLDLKELQSATDETKVIHRPSEKVVIRHGNHWMDFIDEPFIKTDEIYRHHYPLRYYKQMVNKAVLGHKAMISRGGFCGRWGTWHDLYETGKLRDKFDKIVNNWNAMIETGINKRKISEMVEFYAGGNLEQVLEGLSKVEPEIKEWIPLKEQ